MAKEGIGNVGNDKSVNVSTRGLKDVLSVEVIDAFGNQVIPGLPAWDFMSLAQTPLVDTYTFKTGGASGTTVATIAITYTDSTKATISSVTRS